MRPRYDAPRRARPTDRHGVPGPPGSSSGQSRRKHAQPGYRAVDPVRPFACRHGLQRNGRRHQEGRSRDRRRDARGQVVQRGLVGRGPGGCHGHRRHVQQHRHQGAGRLRGQHQDVRRPGLRDDRDRRLRDGRRDDDRRQAVPDRQVHRRRPGRLHRRDRQGRPDLRLRGRPEDAPAELPGSRVQGGAGRLPRRRPCRERLEVGRHRHRRRHQHDPAGRPLHQRLSQWRRVGQTGHRRQGRLRLDRHHQGLQRPGHRQVDRPADDRPEGRRDLPGRRAVRRRLDRGSVRHAGSHRHRRRRRPVEVAAAVGQVHPQQRREEAGRTPSRPRSRRSTPRPTSAARPSGMPRPTRSASACRRSGATTRTSSPRRSRPRSTRPSPG